MLVKLSLLFISSLLVFCESSYVDFLKPCKLGDGDCSREALKNILSNLSPNGFPDAGIPPLDPIQLQDISVTVLDVLHITLVEGRLKGIKNCVVDKYLPQIDKRLAVAELTCDVTLKGKYKVHTTGPLQQSFNGQNTAHGEGNGKVKVDKLKIKFEFYYDLEKRGDDIYFKYKPDKTTYTYDVEGNVVFSIDKLYLGETESSALITGMLNENWRALMPTFGKKFMDIAVKIMSNFIQKFFDTVPGRYIVSDDLTPYL